VPGNRLLSLLPHRWFDVDGRTKTDGQVDTSFSAAGVFLSAHVQQMYDGLSLTGGWNEEKLHRYAVALWNPGIGRSFSIHRR